MASLLALAYGPFIQNLVVVQIDYVEGGLDAQLAFSVDYQYNDINNSGMVYPPSPLRSDSIS